MNKNEQHESFNGEQAETVVDNKLRIGQQATQLMLDLSATELEFSIEIANAILGRLIKRVKREGAPHHRDQLYRMLEQATDRASSIS